MSFLSSSESYFLKQCNKRVLNNVIRGGENRSILFSKTLFPIESARRVLSRMVCATGTGHGKGSSSLLAILGHRSNTGLTDSDPH